jgi:hypothetical protein
MVHVYQLTKVPSASEYVAGLTAIQPRISDKQLRLLQSQYYASNRKITATQLAELANIKGSVHYLPCFVNKQVNLSANTFT